jgi:hypothetical protein
MALSIDVVNTVTTKKIVPGVVDNVFRNSPLLAMIKAKGLRDYSGGPSWQENFLYDTLVPVAYSPGETFDLTQKQIATGGTVTPRYYAVPVSAYLEKLNVEMAGEQAVFSYIDILLQNAALALSARLANDVYRHGQNLSGSDRSKFINGLDEALSDGSTNGFDGRTYPTYLGTTRTDVSTALSSPMTGPAASVSGAITYPILEQAFGSVIIGGEVPDWIVTTNNGLSYIKMAFQAQQRFETSTPDFGFRSGLFNGAKIVADQYCPGARTASSPDGLVGYSTVSAGETLWILNSGTLRLYINTHPLFSFGFTGFIPAQGNSTIAGRYQVALNFTNVAPRLSRQLYAITG